jgi:hypothetical protein
MNHLRLSSLALAVCVAHATGAQAANFDPTGTGSVGIQVDGLDWNTTSFLAKGGMDAIRNFLAGSGSTTFDVYTHAQLSAFQTTSGAISPPGLNSSYEFTMIAGLGMQVTAVTVIPNLPNAGIATFSSTPGGLLSNGSNPFLEIFHDTTPDSVALSGSGYGSANDTLVLRAGAVTNQSDGIFLSFSGSTSPLDLAGANDWPGVNTVTGTGSQTVLEFGDFSFVNTDYFTNGLPGFALSLDSFAFANVSISLPFTNSDPSDCFNLSGDFCSADLPGAPRLEADGPVIPNVGPVNGLLTGFAPDFLAQTDYSSPLRTQVVPVPAAVWLLGSALAGGLTVTRRRRAA